MDVRRRDWPVLARVRQAVMAAVLAGACLAPGCASETVRSHALSQVDKLDTALRRGVSTEVDVLGLLGEPDGGGEFAGFPEYLGPEPARAWYYENSSAELGTSVRERLGILVIFFRENTYEGYYWFRTDTTGTWSSY